MQLTGVDVLEPVVRHVAGETCHLTGWLRQLVQGLHTTHIIPQYHTALSYDLPPLVGGNVLTWNSRLNFLSPS